MADTAPNSPTSSQEDQARENGHNPTVLVGEEHTPSQETVTKAEQLKEDGNKFLAAGKYIQAVEHYSRAIELAPTAIFYGNRSFAYLKMENYGLAILDADEALARDADYLKAYYRRGSAHMALGKYKLALRDFRQVAKLKPNDKDARAKLKECDKAAKEAAFAAAIQSETVEPLCTRIDPESIAIEASYDGPHLAEDGSVTIEFCKQMMQRFKEQKLIAKKYCVMILVQLFQMLSATPSLMRVTIPGGADGHFTVCGDTHGQFYDVLNIFDMNGIPGEDNPYLFNGDYVDRGSFSLEVVLTLFAFKLATPTGIYLTRGNHESKNMNKIYGFEGEVRHKYDASVMSLFSEVFNWLPLAATINDKILVVHGGLASTDDVTLADIEKVDRNREPPDSGLMSDTMWSDPQPFDGRSPSKRGVGQAFGPDITKAFLERNNLELLVRSHEVKEEGYLVEHDGKCITVFSAPNYCDQMGNKGAFIRFGQDLKPAFTKFDAAPHPPIRPMAYAGGFGAMM